MIYKQMFQNFSVERMKLMSVMLGRMEFYFDNRCAFQYLLWEDFEKTGATGRDTENLIDECRRVATVQAAVLLVQQKTGGFRCSLRSNNGIDVQKIAVKYGGGGHKAASGVNLDGPLDYAKKCMLDEIGRQLDGK
jgi:phosphoesterase RecJ-like protein